MRVASGQIPIVTGDKAANLQALAAAVGAAADSGARPRIEYYARCAALEDFAYGRETGREEYAAAAVGGFSWLFPNAGSVMKRWSVAGRASLPQVLPRRRLALSRALTWLAGLAGAVHAGFSLYWALGGQWSLATVGQWAVNLSAEDPLTTGLVLGVVAVAKLLAAAIPIGVAYGRLPWPRFWRAISWAGGLLLVAYGGVNAVVAVAVLAGVIRPAAGYDAVAMMGHAYMWGTLFFLWGTFLVLSLWLSRPSSGLGR